MTPGMISVERILPPNEITLDFEHIIVFLIGTEQKRFNVHGSALRDRSPFLLEAVLDGNRPAAVEKTMRLPDVDCDTFGSYLHWVYTGNLGALIYRCKEAEELSCRLISKVNLWILADSFQDYEYCNAIGDLILEDIGEHRDTIPPEVLEQVGRLTEQEPPLRQLFCDMAASMEEYYPDHDREQDWPRWMLMELGERYFRGKAWENIYDGGLDECSDQKEVKTGMRCRYHRHMPGDECEELLVKLKIPSLLRHDESEDD